MDLGLRGKSALVTGGSKGIGLACARVLAAEGANVCLVARDPERLASARESLLTVALGEITTWAADLSRSEAVVDTMRRHSDVDVLVNNAGAIPGGSIEDIDGERWRSGWDLKVFGYVDATREMLGHMYERRSGVIVNVIGMGGVAHSYEYAVGSSGNASLIAFTNAVGSRSVDRGVRVVGVNPGAVDTDRHRAMVAGGDARSGDSAEAWRDYVTGDLPFGREARPEEIGDLVAFLASDRASYISGTTINIDGGKLFR